MAVPKESYMTLIGGTDNGNSTIYTADDSATQNLIKVGDNIKISGTASNNGVFTVSDITTDGTALGSTGDVYYVLKGRGITSENSGGDPKIEVIRAPGDKLVALGDVAGAGGVGSGAGPFSHELSQIPQILHIEIVETPIIVSLNRDNR